MNEKSNLRAAADAAKADRVNEPAWARPCHSIHCRHYDLAGGIKCEEQVRREKAAHDMWARRDEEMRLEQGRPHLEAMWQAVMNRGAKDGDRKVAFFFKDNSHVCNCKGVQRERHIKRGSCDV